MLDTDGGTADEPPKLVTRDDVSDASDLESLADDADPIDAPQTAGPRTVNGAPMPDLRFEQAYLTALRRTDMRPITIARVTLIDFLLWPMAQGFLWALGLNGFRYLRTASNANGKQFGLVLRDFLNIGGVLD